MIFSIDFNSGSWTSRATRSVCSGSPRAQTNANFAPQGRAEDFRDVPEKGPAPLGYAWVAFGVAPALRRKWGPPPVKRSGPTNQGYGVIAYGPAGRTCTPPGCRISARELSPQGSPSGLLRKRPNCSTCAIAKILNNGQKDVGSRWGTAARGLGQCIFRGFWWECW
jgi:hypothetical protein